MTATLEALKDKPVAYFQMDDTAPFQDYSGYNRAGTVTGTPTTTIPLTSGAVYSTVFNRNVIGKFESSVFQQGSEDKAFTLESWMYPIRKTSGYAAQKYRENLIMAPKAGATIPASGYVGAVGGSAGGIQQVSGITDLPGFSTGYSYSSVDGTASARLYTRAMSLSADKSYRAGVWVKGVAGESYRIAILEWSGGTIAGGGGGVNSFVATGAWEWKETTVSGYTGDIRFEFRRSGSVGAVTFYATGFVLAEQSAWGGYVDGDVPGFEWSGEPRLSTSRARSDISRVNRILNPSSVTTSNMSWSAQTMTGHTLTNMTESGVTFNRFAVGAFHVHDTALARLGLVK